MKYEIESIKEGRVALNPPAGSGLEKIVLSKKGEKHVFKDEADFNNHRSMVLDGYNAKFVSFNGQVLGEAKVKSAPQEEKEEPQKEEPQKEEPQKEEPQKEESKSKKDAKKKK